MLKRRAVHKDMAEANVYAARRLKDMAQSLGGLAKTFGRCREEPGLSREDGIAALEAASAMVCGACESCGIQRECRRGGDDENYYLVAYDAAAGIIKHYRVDKMQNTEILETDRKGEESFKNFDLAAFAKKTFGMYGGVDAEVTLECKNELAGVIIDRFGHDVWLIPQGEDHFKTRVLVSVSPQFFGWVTGIGSGMKITGPDNVKSEYKAYLQDVLENY